MNQSRRLMNNIYKEIDDARTPEELRAIMRRVDPGSPMWTRAQARLNEFRHGELRPPPWYRQLAIWISIIALIIAILSWLLPRH
jgi:hypothetical protein